MSVNWVYRGRQHHFPSILIQSDCDTDSGSYFNIIAQMKYKSVI